MSTGGSADTTGISLMAVLLGGWEMILVLAVILLLFSTRSWPRSAGEAPRRWDRHWAKFGLFLAQGFGVGRVPFAPGTWGSLVGLLWFAALLNLGDWWAYLIGVGVGVALSITICGEAEEILQQKDPSSVVLDEIVSLPICFVPLFAGAGFVERTLPPVTVFLREHWLVTLEVFVLFRFFDIVKPWPVGRSQRWPRGWGVTMDDVLAAAYVALLLWGALALGWVRRVVDG